MERATELSTRIETDGFAIREGVLDQAAIARLLNALDQVGETTSVRKRGGVFAVRNLLDISPDIQALASSNLIRQLVEPVLGPKFFPVRGILFDKIPDANWKVPWHQDMTIAVQEKIEVEGFGPWSIKAGVLHVQPPAAVLENMLTVRLHLDPCSEKNGALRIIPGSHLYGKIPESIIEAIRLKEPEVVCAINLGGALLMRPLLLHASHPSSHPGHRRVIHLDFARELLPSGLRWLSEFLELSEAPCSA